MKKWYVKLAKLAARKKVSLYSDAILLVASGYLIIKKAFDFSISGWLLKHALQQPAVNLYVYVSGTLLVAAILVKVFAIIMQLFPVANLSAVHPEEISECLLIMNKEISNHLNKCDGEKAQNIKQLNEQHAFDVNIRLIVDALAEHIRKSIDTIKIKRKDLFISLYTFDAEKGELQYELHYDPKRDLVKSKIIDVKSKKYKQYECVQCINSEHSTVYTLEKDSYAKGDSKRYKTFSQYMGCKIETNGTVFGFLNIEFHNYQVFMDIEDAKDFMEENIYPFKLLLEYQYLKREFFAKFSEFDKHWEVA